MPVELVDGGDDAQLEPDHDMSLVNSSNESSDSSGNTDLLVHN